MSTNVYIGAARLRVFQYEISADMSPIDGHLEAALVVLTVGNSGGLQVVKLLLVIRNLSHL